MRAGNRTFNESNFFVCVCVGGTCDENDYEKNQHSRVHNYIYIYT